MCFYIVYRLNPTLVSGLIPILSQHSELDWMVSVGIKHRTTKNMYLIMQYNIYLTYILSLILSITIVVHIINYICTCNYIVHVLNLFVSEQCYESEVIN